MTREGIETYYPWVLANFSTRPHTRDSVSRLIASLTTAGLLAVAIGVSTAPPAAATPGQATFAATGAAQTWNIPSGVLSAYITLEGGTGGSDGSGNTFNAAAARLAGTLTWPSGTTQLGVYVGGTGGQATSKDSPGAGGWNGGLAGGTASETAFAGGGGGGATDIRVGGSDVSNRVMVAAGGGGAGGSLQVSVLPFGGAGGVGGNGAATNGVWPGNVGATPVDGSNPGSGGAGGQLSTGNGSAGGNAGDLTGNGGGGGGGGGWFGGAGGQAGQGDFLGVAGAGGGGGGGASYANPDLVTNASASPAFEVFAASARVQWVDITSTSLPTLSVGTPVNQGLSASFPNDAVTLQWSVVSGALPAGLSLNPGGVLTGTPSAAGAYDVTVNVAAGPDALATSQVRYTGSVRGVPTPPLDVQATSAFESVVVEWNAPTSDSGSAITGYAVQYSANSGSTWTDATANTGSTATTYTVSGLTVAQPYIFRVSAINSVGASNWSGTSPPVTPEIDPQAPVELRGTPGNTQVALTWGAPSSFGSGTLTGYTIQALGGDYDAWTTLATTSGSGTTFTASSLANGTGYEFRVAAVTNVGTGPYSKSSGTLVPFTVPGAPTGLVATAGDGSASLSWSAPSAQNGRGITGYRIEVSTGGGWSVTTSNTGTARTTATVSGLSNGTSYRFRVSAINAAGVGDPSSASNVVVPSGGGGGSSGGDDPAPASNPTVTPTLPPAPETTPHTTPGVVDIPQPTVIIPGLILVPPGSDIPVRTLPVRSTPARTLTDAPRVSVRRNVAFALRVHHLPAERTFRVFVARGDTPPLRWKAVGVTKTGPGGRAILPAMLSTRDGVIGVRLTSGRLERYLDVRVRR